LGGLLNGQGQTGFVLKMGLVTGLIGFPMGYVMIMRFGVLGLIATLLTANIPSIIMGLWFIKKTYGVSVDWGSSAKILFSSAVAAIVTFVTISLLSFSSWVELVLGVVLFLLVLLPVAIFTRT
jgi:O-antigen/teichoic acid export membrane protein